MKRNKVREKYLDILKTIGLLCIILAHVNPPKILFQLRNFDVVLMILISSYLSLKKQKEHNIKPYIIKRAKRLILPTYIFLTFFFIVAYFTNIYDITIENILESYALSNYGIGYVWVIRIYFIIVLLIPIYNYLETTFNNKNLLFLV